MSKQGPKAFRTDDPALRLTTEHAFESEPIKNDDPHSPDLDKESDQELHPLKPPSPNRSFGWGSLLLLGLAGLFSLAAGLWFTQFVQNLFARDDWIGWTAMALLALTVLAFVMIIAKELYGLSRMKKVTRLKEEATQILEQNNEADAPALIRKIISLYKSRTDLDWSLKNLKQYDQDILDAKQRFTLAERELLLPLDSKAKRVIATAARRVSVVTAVSPAAILDVVYVGFENLRMLRRLAALYGGRPGTFGTIRLAQMVITHLVLTGGLALSSDFIQQLIGQKLTAKLSARLGEGIFNGAMCARIGMAAVHICRPLPFIEAKPPRFRDFFAEIFKSSETKSSNERAT